MRRLAELWESVNLPDKAGLSNLRGGPALRASFPMHLFSSVLGRGCICTALPTRWPSSSVPALRRNTPRPRTRPFANYLAAVQPLLLPRPYINTRLGSLANHPSPMYNHSPNSTAQSLHRKTSSKAHLASLKMPLSHSSSRSSSYQPSTRQADISRLLDPAYASSSSHSPHSSTTNVGASATVYVDHKGEMHDPDYRDFPVLPPRQQKNLLTKPRRSSSTHSRIPSSAAPQNRPDRYRTYPLVARPEWERGWATEVEDLDEEDEEQSSYEGAFRSPFSSSSSSSDRTPSSHRASLPPSVYAYTPSTYYFAEPTSTTSSPVDSLEEEERDTTGQSPFDDMILDEDRPPSRSAASILKKMKRSSSGSSTPVAPSRSSHENGEDKENQSQPHEMHFIDRDDDDDVYVSPPAPSPSSASLTALPLNRPSCTHILHRHLRALNLRLRFGVFHAKRRLSISRRRKSSSS